MFEGKKFKITYFLALAAFTGYALLDTFVIPRSYSTEIVQEDMTLNATDGAVTVNKSIFEEAKGSNANAESIAASAAAAAEETEVASENTESTETTEKKKSGNHSGGAPAQGGSPSGKPGEKKSGRSSGGKKLSKATATASEIKRPSSVKKSSDVTETETETVSTTVDTVSSDVVLGSYEDNIKTITLSEYRANDTSIYVADVQLIGDATTGDDTAYSDADLIKTALANSTYGKNVKAETSVTAAENNAILAINGDFYGAQNAGYVIRNGVLYRDTSAGNEDLAILADGSFEIFSEDDLSAEEVLNAGAVDVLSFGPGLVEDGEISVTEDEEVGKAMASNPRTAIGILEDGHYVFVVTDGRTDESEGLTLYQLAEFMKSLGCKTAYNLDGGGSSTMYFNGQIINNPTTGGNNIKERSVSDIVYISK